jgi:hypothetical protein
MKLISSELTTSANTTLLLTGDTERDQRIKFCLFSLPSLPTELADGLGLRGALLELLACAQRLKGNWRRLTTHFKCSIPSWQGTPHDMVPPLRSRYQTQALTIATELG